MSYEVLSRYQSSRGIAEITRIHNDADDEISYSVTLNGVELYELGDIRSGFLKFEQVIDALVSKRTIDT